MSLDLQLLSNERDREKKHRMIISIIISVHKATALNVICVLPR